jgi:hypothetical protein
MDVPWRLLGVTLGAFPSFFGKCALLFLHHHLLWRTLLAVVTASLSRGWAVMVVAVVVMVNVGAWW